MLTADETFLYEAMHGECAGTLRTHRTANAEGEIVARCPECGKSCTPFRIIAGITEGKKEEQ